MVKYMVTLNSRIGVCKVTPTAIINVGNELGG